VILTERSGRFCRPDLTHLLHGLEEVHCTIAILATVISPEK